MRELVEITARLLVGGLLLAAGAGKLKSTWTWRMAWLASYHLLPRAIVKPVSILLPGIEVTCAIALMLGAFGRWSAIAATLLIALVTTTVVSALIRGLTVSCGCFGAAMELVSWRIVWRNLILMAALGAVAIHDLTLPAIESLAWPVQTLIVGLVAGSTATLIVHKRRRTLRRLLERRNHGFATHASA